ncbi:hypothetical protein [Marinibacterium sp. SX1]|uniref:hypothetical protein n=1 Tax=Marinibacterium sp. SX1 TaxID=3388424 RepID=UPI003D176F07
MTRIDIPVAHDLDTTMAAMIRAHGFLRVIRAAMAARRKPPPVRRRTAPRVLSNHIRRDIGLSPVATSPPHWTRFP